MGSDHFPLHIGIHLQTLPFPYTSHTAHSGNIEWTVFHSFMTEHINDIKYHHQTIEAITDLITKYLNTFHPLCTIIQQHSKNINTQLTPGWWTPMIKKEIARRKLLTTQFIRNPNYVTYHNLQLQTTLTKRLIRQTKQRSWQIHCQAINPHTSTTQMWRQIKWFTGKKNYSMTEIQYNTELQDKFLQLHSPDSVPLPPYMFPNLPKSSITDTIDQNITTTEVNLTINKHKQKSVGGPDGITYEMLRHLPLEYQNILANGFTKILQTGIIPQS